MNIRASQAYMQTNVSTTDQGHLLLMLYDGALKFLQQAREKMLEKDYAAKGILISKVIDIVNELSSSLNMERGGELATNLNNLYFLCTARLLEANLKMSVERLDSVSQILSGLRSAYAQIIDKPEAKKAVAEISARMHPAASLPQRKPVPQAVAPLSNSNYVPRSKAQAAYGRSAQQAAPPAGRPAEAPRPEPAVTPTAPAAPAAATPPPPEAARQMARPVAAPVPPRAPQPVAGAAQSGAPQPAPVAPQPGNAPAEPEAAPSGAAQRTGFSGLPPRRVPSAYTKR